MEERPGLLDALMDEMGRQEDIHKPGLFWKEYAARMAEALRTEGVSRFRSSIAVGRGFADVDQRDPLHPRPPPGEPLPPAYLRGMQRLQQVPTVGAGLGRLWGGVYAGRSKAWRQGVLGEAMADTVRWYRDRYGLPDTLVGHPARTVVVDGDTIGENYLRAFGWIRDLVQEGIEPKRVVEIGGGFGAFAHVLWHTFDLECQVYVDVPPTLYVGTCHLAAHVPVDDHLATAGDAAIKPREGRITAIPPWRMQAVEGSFDLAWNSSSFQEMPAEAVGMYGEQMHRLLAPDGALALYLYDGAHHATRPHEEVLALMEQRAGRRPRPLADSYAAPAVPGRLFVG